MQGQSHLPDSTLSACHSAGKDNLVPSLSRRRLSISPNSCPATAFCSLSPAILASESWKAQSSVASGPLHWPFLLPALLPSGLLRQPLCILQVSIIACYLLREAFFLTSWKYACPAVISYSFLCYCSFPLITACTYTFICVSSYSMPSRIFPIPQRWGERPAQCMAHTRRTFTIC